MVRDIDTIVFLKTQHPGLMDPRGFEGPSGVNEPSG